MSQGDAPDSGEGPSQPERDAPSRRQSVRLSTVYGGRICQFGKAYPCIISDVSEGGVKVRLKVPQDYERLAQSGSVQLIFERLSDYKALNGEIAWRRPQEHAVGLRFTDPELRRRVVIKRLMPNRWRIANRPQNGEDAAGEDDNESRG